jgi:hypothetical protein
MRRIDISYRNPWCHYGVNVNNGPEIYSRLNKIMWQSECGRGMIIKVTDAHFDYLVGGLCVAQRTVRQFEYLALLIEVILDNKPTKNYNLLRAKNIYEKQRMDQ